MTPPQAIACPMEREHHTRTHTRTHTHTYTHTRTHIHLHTHTYTHTFTHTYIYVRLLKAKERPWTVSEVREEVDAFSFTFDAEASHRRGGDANGPVPLALR